VCVNIVWGVSRFNEETLRRIVEYEGATICRLHFWQVLSQCAVQYVLRCVLQSVLPSVLQCVRCSVCVAVCLLKCVYRSVYVAVCVKVYKNRAFVLWSGYD